jgi:hypothetical protein
MIYKNIKTNIQIIVHQVIRKLLFIRQSKKRKKRKLVNVVFKFKAQFLIKIMQVRQRLNIKILASRKINKF